MAEPLSPPVGAVGAVEAIGRMILDGPGEWTGSGAQLHELATLIATRVGSARAGSDEQATDPVPQDASMTGRCRGDRHSFSSSYRDGEDCVRCGKRLCTWCGMVGGHREGCDRATDPSEPTVEIGGVRMTQRQFARARTARYPLAHPGSTPAPAGPEADRTEPHPVTGVSIPIKPDGSTDWARFAGELLRSVGPVGSTTSENGTAEPGGLDRVDDETRLQQVCLALNEPYRTPGDSPRDPDWVMTWERALDILAERTTAWSTLLQRAESADAEWLNQWRGSLTTGPQPEDRRDGPVSGDDALDALDALCQISHEAYERAAAAAEWFTNPASRVAWADVPESNKVAMRAAVAAVAVRVRSQTRAEAVAEEWQRIKAELHELAQLLPVEEAQRTSTWLARAFGTSQVAAGSVPVATPEPSRRTEPYRACAGCDGPDPCEYCGYRVATPAEQAEHQSIAHIMHRSDESRTLCGEARDGIVVSDAPVVCRACSDEVLNLLCSSDSAAESSVDTGTPADEVPTGEWRVGESYRIHVYAGDRPVATFHQEQDAARAVAAVNALGDGG